jgi:acyl-ACP thioesterase
LPSSAKKVTMPNGIEPEFVGTHKISYSDIDIIGHTNNARYVLWAMDAIDYGLASSKRIKDFQINFNKETVPGDAVDIYRIVRNSEYGITYNVEGVIDGKLVFCAEVGY